MMNILADALLIATGQTPPVRGENHYGAARPVAGQGYWQSRSTKVVKS
jgi:hypothetical protein